MNNNQQEPLPGDSDKKEESKAATEEPKQGIDPPDAEDASAEEMQESDFGDKSYAAPDFDNEDD